MRSELAIERSNTPSRLYRCRDAAGRRTLRLSLGWGMWIAALALSFTIRDVVSAWVWMWLVGLVIFLGFKLLTLLRLDAAARQELSPLRIVAYELAWPGMRPEPFFRSATPAANDPALWLDATWKLLLGMLLLWGGPMMVPADAPLWLRAWLGMVGFSLILHFGLFDLIAAAWRWAGIPVEQVFQSPIRAVSLGEFWGSRWNRAFADFSRDLLLRPLARIVGSRVALFAVFLFSGLLHELVISFPARGGYGLPTAYFALQGLLVLVESSRLAPRAVIRSRSERTTLRGWLWTATGVLLPAPLLFHAPFLERVVLPFLQALSAG